MAKIGREILMVPTKEEADDLMEYMRKKCREVGLVTVAEFKQKAKMASSRMDQEYGWYQADDIYWKKTNYGYEVHMPKAVLLT